MTSPSETSLPTAFSNRASASESPRQRARFRKPGIALVAGAFGACVLLSPFGAPVARADQVSPKGKGIVGGALLGAEVVTMVESFAGVRAGWAYGVGALAGAAGGGVGGFFVEKGNTDGRAPTYMLAGGLALIIPAVILTLNATRYMPEEGASEDRAPTAPAAEPGAPTVPPPDVVPPATTPPASAPAAPPRAPQSGRAPLHPAHTKAAQASIAASLLDVREGDLRLGVPLPDVLAVFSIAEQRQYGMRSETELRLPVLHVTF